MLLTYCDSGTDTVEAENRSNKQHQDIILSYEIWVTGSVSDK